RPRVSRQCGSRRRSKMCASGDSSASPVHLSRTNMTTVSDGSKTSDRVMRAAGGALRLVEFLDEEGAFFLPVLGRRAGMDPLALTACWSRLLTQIVGRGE